MSGRELDLDDMRTVVAFSRLVVRRLVGMDAVTEATASLASTAVAGLLLWLWGRQHVADLPREMVEGQSRTLWQLIESIGQHWPPAPATWFSAIQDFHEQTTAALDTLEDLPYDDGLYPRIDEIIGGIAEQAEAILTRVRSDRADRVPDAAAWILGTLVEVNTYSWTEGSVPENISDRLQQVYSQIAVDGDDLFMPWLMRGFEQVRERTPDELERWRYGLDRARHREADMDDESVFEDARADEQLPRVPAERLTRAERESQIRDLLEEIPTDTMDGLPEGLAASILDESDVSVLEDSLDPDAPTSVLGNAVKAIGVVADWEWNDRVIASPDTSIPRLVGLYQATGIRKLRRLVIFTLFRFDPTDIPFEFLLDRLAEDHAELKGETLSELQRFVALPYLEDLVHGRLLGMLHGFCGLPLRGSVYNDELVGEMDFRFWVFRCLRLIGSQDSVPVIEQYLNANDWPLDTLAEAVHAHWALTHRLDYLPVLREAKKRGVLGNTESGLKEMERLSRAEARRRKATS
jgi:hypothetical protein